MDARVNIRPGVSVLSVLRHLNYNYWNALAEFVDNALQSWVANKDAIAAADPQVERLRVSVNLRPQDGGVITIRDNAAGIRRADFGRAFKPAAAPPDRSGLSEFGMGMKSAACWSAREWTVRTKPLGDAHEYFLRFNIGQIVAGEIEELDVEASPAPPNDHYTEVRLEGLHKIPAGRTLGKVKQHLADIYREFFRRGELDLSFDGDQLEYQEPKVLAAPYFKEESADAKRWRAPIDLGVALL